MEILLLILIIIEALIFIVSKDINERLLAIQLITLMMIAIK